MTSGNHQRFSAKKLKLKRSCRKRVRHILSGHAHRLAHHGNDFAMKSQCYHANALGYGRMVNRTDNSRKKRSKRVDRKLSDMLADERAAQSEV